MRDASLAYIQEEKRLRGARPRLKVILSPFDLDYGLAPGLGEFDQTECGDSAGKLQMQTGYRTAGYWTSPVMQSYMSPTTGAPASGISAVATLSWADRAGYLEKTVKVRSAADYDQLGAAPYLPVVPGQEFDLQALFQLKVDLWEVIRGWALDAPEETDAFAAHATDLPVDGGYESFASDGNFPGFLEEIELMGEMVLPESEIINPGDISTSLSVDFANLPAGENTLLMDNRSRQWIPGGGSFYLQAIPWFKKFVKVYHGFEVPGGEVEWLLLYVGQIEKISGMTHGWGQAHTARLETVDLVMKLLAYKIGAPDADGGRRPFMRGYWQARAELTGVTEPICDVQKQGSGSATLFVADDEAYVGTGDALYSVEIENSGEVGAVNFRWSKDQGHTWVATGLRTAGINEPVELEENLTIYWCGGLGTDLVAGDRWQIAAYSRAFHYLIAGAPFEAMTGVAVNGEKNRPGVSAAAETGTITVKGGGGEVTARVVKDTRTHPVDIILDILTEVGLESYIDEESFNRARSDTLEYAIGVCFENVAAGQAILQIVKNCLFDFWVEFGCIRIRAYLGEG